MYALSVRPTSGRDLFTYENDLSILDQDYVSYIPIVNYAYIQPFTLIPQIIKEETLVDVDNLLSPTTEKVFLPGDWNYLIAGQCVNFIRYSLDDKSDLYTGNADQWEQYINSEEAKVGSIAVFRVGRWGHIGIVIKVDEETITVRSRNWQGLWIISDDIFNKDDKKIIGYIQNDL